MKKAILFGVLLSLSSLVTGATLTVINTNDAGAGSLRDQIALMASGDTIVFDISLNGDSIILTSGEIAFSKDITIIGLGYDSLTVSGNHNSRIFNNNGGNFSVSQITLSDGYALGNGGAIQHLNSGSLTLNNVYFLRDSLGAPGSGGAVYYDNTLNSVYIDSNYFVNCAATSSAGAIFLKAAGACTLKYCLFNGNSTTNGDIGAASLNIGADSIIGCTFMNNSSNSGCSALQLNFYQNHVVSCTFSNNQSGNGYGALLYVSTPLNVHRVVNCTFTNNSASVSLGAALPFDAAIYTFYNNIFDDIGPNLVPITAWYSLNSAGGNISNDGSLAFGNTNDFNNTNPTLDVLANNGGLMPTHNLLAGSPAIGNAMPGITPIFDQIGNPRIGLPESGSMEFNPCANPDIPSLTATQTTVCAGDNTTINISGNLNSATDWFVYTGSCGTGFLIQTNSNSIGVLPTTTTTYYIRGEGGCVSPGNCDSITITVTQPSNGTDVITQCDSLTWLDGNTYATNNNTATFNIIGGAASGCDSLVTLDLTITNTALSNDTRTECSGYVWLDGNPYTANNNTATFNITGGAANGCDSLITLDLTINTVDTSLTVLGNTITANATGATFQWYDCSSGFVIIVGATNAQYTPPASGSYSVIVTQNGCSQMSSCIPITIVGINENTLFNNVSIYPNPNQGLVNINLGVLQGVSIKVFSVTGQLLINEVNINTSVYQFELNEAKGIYFLEIESQGERKQFKLIKQ